MSAAVRVAATVDVARDRPGAIVFRVARRLRSPNTWQGHHWRVKDNETKSWQRLLLQAAPLSLPEAILRWRALAGTPAEWDQGPERRLVLVTRCVPSRQNFIRDEDNLRFTTKPLNDALKRMGLIYQDSRRWLEQPMPEQRVSGDGQDWTEITIGPCEGPR
jgi:hypothetical protein